MKTLIWIVVLVALISIVGYAISKRGDGNDNGTATTSDTTSPLRTEDSAIVVVEQAPGTTAIASLAYLAVPGFVVVHEDMNGAPGAILGASLLLEAGETTNVQIPLSRRSVDGELLHAMLHRDTDGNGVFNATVDAPVQSRLGGPIEGWFEISSDASSGGAVSI